MVEWGDNVKISDTAPGGLPAGAEGAVQRQGAGAHVLLARASGWLGEPGLPGFPAPAPRADGPGHSGRLPASGGRTLRGRPTAMPVADLVDQGETTTVEFKSTLRINLHTGEKDPRMELSVLKTLAALRQQQRRHPGHRRRRRRRARGHRGGQVPERGQDVPAPGQPDQGPHGRGAHDVPAPALRRLRPASRVLAVECLRGKSPVFVKDGKIERFYIRTGAATAELTGSQAQDFIKQRFGG